MKAYSLSRRKMISAGGLASLGAVTSVMGTPSGDTATRVDLSGPHLDVRTPRGALVAQARVCGNIEPAKARFDWFDGQVLAVAPNGNVTPFAGIRGFIEANIRDEGEHWHRHRRLVATYYDPASGKRIDELHNPFNGKQVTVAHIDGAVCEDRLEMQSTHWCECGANFQFQDSSPVSFHSDSPLQCLSGLSIDSHTGSMTDLQDASRSMVEDRGTWTLISDWLPWLQMEGHVAGHCVVQCARGGGVALLSELPAAILTDRARRHYT